MVEIKTDLKSCEMKEGYMRSPQRSLLYALGLTPEEINRPLVGIVNSFNEVVPGHMHLRQVAEGHGTPSTNTHGISKTLT